jgi:hypothetical protein
MGAALDRYITGNYGEDQFREPWVPRCQSCHAFLPWTPDKQEPWEETLECDGTATTEWVVREGAMVDILGPGVDRYMYSACGSTGGDHTPHTEVVAAGVTFTTTCRRCGYVNVDRDY